MEILKSLREALGASESAGDLGEAPVLRQRGHMEDLCIGQLGQTVLGVLVEKSDRG